MNFLILESRDPYWNLAVEEYLFRYDEDDVFMLWQNDPTVVIGKNQNVYAEINWELIREQDISIARRITGGGAVYHDGGNVNYTFISSANREKCLDFSFFTAPILDALKEMGVCACLSGRNDLLVDGKKFSGNAQYSSGGRTLHHGTLLFDSDLELLSSVLRVDEEKLRSKAIRSTRSRVTNLKPLLLNSCTTQEFLNRIAHYVIHRYDPQIIPVPENKMVDILRARNASREWLFPEKGFLSEYQLVKKKRYSFGTVEIYLDMTNEAVKDVKICGDFFGSEPIEGLERHLTNINAQDLSERLALIDMNDYIFGMSREELLEQILS